MGGLTIFDTHPIQYRSPIFVDLFRRYRSVRIYYFNHDYDGDKFWFHERKSNPTFQMGVELERGFPCQTLDSKTSGLWKFYKTVRKILREEKPEAALIYGYYLPEHWILWVECLRQKIPLLFIGETLSRETTGFRRFIRNLLVPLFFKGVSRFVSIGNKSEAFYRSFKIKREKILPAKYCCDVQYFQLPPHDSMRARNETRSALKIPNEAFVVLCVGRLFHRKRPWDALAIHRRLPKGNHTLLVGTGPLEKEFQNLQVEGFHFLGSKTQSELRNLYYSADFLLLPSEYETWGVVVNEAFSCSLPAIVTENCGNADDLVLHGETGFIYPVGDVKRAAKLLTGIQKDRLRLSRISSSAKERVMTYYQVPQFSNAIIAALQSLKRRESSPQFVSST